MDEREYKPPAMRPTTRGLCILMACTDMQEADQVGRQLLEVNSGCLVTYRKAEDFMLNTPAGKVALVVLADSETPARLGRTLKWLRHRWPRCPITVVGDEGGGDFEIAARQGGACFLTRPVSQEQWAAVLAHVLGTSPAAKADAV